MSASLVEVHPDAEALATTVAGALIARLAEAQEAGREPQVALTGGTIADAVHRELARLGPGSPVDWSRVVFWWGDERFVARDSEDRNAGQARRAFLDVVGATQVHEMPATEDAPDVEAAARAFEEVMRAHGSSELEVVMLGLGPDGHVASLFPHHPALDVTDRIVVGLTDSPKPPPARLTLTVNALRRSRSVWVVASGEGKADAVAAALAPDEPGQADPQGADHGRTETERVDSEVAGREQADSAPGSPAGLTPQTAATPARAVHGRLDTTYFLDRPAASRL